jgi:pimeloyl-ACP methyl ester carboxylesterase
MHLRRKLVLSVLVAASASGIVAGCSSLDQWERRTIFQHEAALRVDGRDAPEGATEFDLAVPGGGVTGRDKVHVWYLAATQADKGATAPTVLYLHGARHNLYGNAARLERLQALGYNVLALDYRGFGRSTLILPSEDSAIEDARLAYAELVRREPDPARRIVYGYSLGGAVAIALARSIDESGGEDIAGVVVESSFTSIPDVVRTMRWGWLPFLPLAVTNDFDSERRIGAVNKPLLFLHGTADSIVPHTMSDRLYAAARNVPEQYKRVIKIDGASHRGALSMAAGDYGDALRQFATLAASRAATHASTRVASGAMLQPTVAAGAMSVGTQPLHALPLH